MVDWSAIRGLMLLARARPPGSCLDTAGNPAPARHRQASCSDCLFARRHGSCECAPRVDPIRARPDRRVRNDVMRRLCDATAARRRRVNCSATLPGEQGPIPRPSCPSLRQSRICRGWLAGHPCPSFPLSLSFDPSRTSNSIDRQGGGILWLDPTKPLVRPAPAQLAPLSPPTQRATKTCPLVDEAARHT